MLHRARRSVPAALAVLAAVAVVSDVQTVHAEPLPIEARLSCERRPGKGRVVCEVEVEVAAGRIAWADVVVVAAPEIARPLKSRVGFREASARTERRVRLPIALVATELGEGDLTVVVRSVLCRRTGDDDTCVPRRRAVTGHLSVGPIRSRTPR